MTALAATDPAALKDLIEAALAERLPDARGLATDLTAALRYATLGGGKRLRPLLVLTTAEALGADRRAALPAACAVEFLHIYSLVHDDLPAMDDDALRHGKPSCHVAHGEATAILTGDALQALAFATLADAPLLNPATRIDMVAALARAAGPDGMVGGQALDMAATGRNLALADLETLHRAKTGALIAACVELGALAGGADHATRRALAEFSGAIGLAFQVIDDILDATASTETLGKPGGSDAALGKVTYPAVIGLDAARRYASELQTQAHDALERCGLQTSALAALANRMVERAY